jgi:dihydropteroate synthase
MIDIGAYSSRPGADDVTPEEELRRLEMGLKVIRDIDSDIIVSVDTFRADVAREAIAMGANIINDISGGNLDDKMFDTVASLKVPYILMHMRGTPQTMSSLTQYDDITADVLKDLSKKVNRLSLLGVSDIIIDPGFGFGKTIEQNFEMMRNLEAFNVFGCPVLVGISRKSMIYRTLDISAEQALSGTTTLNTMALLSGASILRVHDVKEARQSIKLLELTYNKTR